MPKTAFSDLFRGLPLEALDGAPGSHDHVYAAIADAQGLIGGRSELSEDEACAISIQLGTDAGARPVLDVADVIALARLNGGRRAA